MAKPIEMTETLAELIRVGDASRQMLTDSHARMHGFFDIPARIKNSITEMPGKWLGGSLVAGLAASFLFRRKKAPEKTKALKRKGGALLGILSLAFAIGKPLAKVYATKMLREYLASRFSSGSDPRIVRRQTPPY